MKKKPVFLLATLAFITALHIPSAQENVPIDMDALAAREEFRWGVVAYNDGNFNEAVLAFEKSLAIAPGDTLVQQWLGNAYHRSGYVETALGIWRRISAAGEATAYLESVIDTVSIRRSLARELSPEPRFVVANQISGTLPEYTLFSRPSGLAVMDDGSFYVCAFVSAELLHFTVNGVLRARNQGGLEGFDGPFDVVNGGDGTLFVSEFAGDRISRIDLDSGRITRFGGSGTRDGSMVGPQYLAVDGKGYLYVTDLGNRRVSKFDYQGRFILSFGSRTRTFGGFRQPSGIAVLDDRIYVSDTSRAAVEVFDLNGNHLKSLTSGGLSSPEGISVYPGRKLLVADSKRLVLLDPESETFRVLVDMENSAGRIITGRLNVNGDLVVTDFDRNTITQFTDLGGLYAGLSVRLDRIDASRFPEVLVDFGIETRFGDPIAGLDNSNFIITEDRYGVREKQLVRDIRRDSLDIVALIERTPQMSGHRTEIRSAVGTLFDAVQGDGSIQVVTAGREPVLETKPGFSRLQTVDAASESGEYAAGWRFDLGVRLAASRLIPGRSKRAVVFVSRGELTPDSLGRYGLIELADYMKNNGVRFYVLYTDPAAAFSAELDYLCRETGGGYFGYHDPRGALQATDHLSGTRNDTYTLRYVSASPSRFGNAYIPVEIEAFLFNRSGRGESGYFTMLEF